MSVTIIIVFIIGYAFIALESVTKINKAAIALLMFAIMKVIPITLTAAGIAGFIISLGMAVDANVLVFERMKEELRKGKLVKTAVEASVTHAAAQVAGRVSVLFAVTKDVLKPEGTVNDPEAVLTKMPAMEIPMS